MEGRSCSKAKENNNKTSAKDNSGKNTLVVNLFGGPGTGKSHMAARLYGNCDEYEAELVREYAKDLVWENRTIEFSEQLCVIGKQIKRVNAVYGKVDVIFTDSPILLGAYYGKNEELSKQLLDIHSRYNNLNIFLRRVKKYNPNGRFQTEEEADKISCSVRDMLVDYNVAHIVLDATKEADAQVMRLVQQWFKNNL